ncbi:hypothetical protein KR018_008229 [Drosophila ironensis]|nr:hypothetical protein KR018_008229 [Drosophila ironensis]
MAFVRFALFCSLFYTIKCNGTTPKSMWDDESDYQVPIYRIQRVNIYGDASYMKVYAYTNGDDTAFSIEILLRQELGSNFLMFNIKLRVKPEGGVAFVKLFQLRGLDLCEFFTELSSSSMMRYFLRSTMQLSDVITCPIRAGKYSLKNVGARDIYPHTVQNGTYKFFVEVIEGTGEIVKVFALQVTSDIRVPSKPEKN